MADPTLGPDRSATWPHFKHFGSGPILTGVAVLTIVLDLDGTLVESAPDLMTALNNALEHAGRARVSLEAVRGMVGDGIPALVARGLDATGGSLAEAELAATTRVCLDYYLAHTNDASYLYPGVATTLGALRDAGHALAVCTNKPEDAAVALLDAFELLPLLECVVGGDTFSFRKPDPRMLTATIERVARPSAAAVMVGDSRNDLQLARRAGVPVVLASFGYCDVPVGELAPDAVIDSFTELPLQLQQLGLL